MCWTLGILGAGGVVQFALDGRPGRTGAWLCLFNSIHVD